MTMKNLQRFGVLTLICGVAALVFTGCPTNGDDGNDPNKLAGTPKLLDITINRAASGSGNFVFNTNAVSGADAYKAYKGAGEVASSATNTVSVPSTALSDRSWTALTAKALKGAEDASLVTALPGMVKYPADTPTLNGYTDWFNFLNATLTSFGLVNQSAYEPYNSLRNSIRTVLNSGGIISETDGKEYEARWKTQMNNATAAVMANWEAIWGNLLTNEGRLNTVNDTMPRIWFNQVTNSENDAALGGIIIPQIKAEYPQVKTVF